MAETRVDLRHPLEDLRDGYPGSTEETILTEIIANSLDSGATRTRILADPASASVTISDNGSGTPRRDLRRYHELAASRSFRCARAGAARGGVARRGDGGGARVRDDLPHPLVRSRVRVAHATRWTREGLIWIRLRKPPGAIVLR